MITMSKVLFVAVHPDDETLGCGGTILKHKDSGDEIYWVIVTRLTHNHPNNYSDEAIARRDLRVQEVAKTYGFNKTFELGFPTTCLHSVDLSEIISRFSDVINEIKPDIVYTMFANDVHSDHRVAFNALYSCTKSFRYPFIKRLYMIEALSETEFAPSFPSDSFCPNVFVDITPYIEKKMEIMSMYKTEVMQEPYPRSLSSIRALARVRGSRAGVMYAEAFQLLYERR